jgi:hypothetical protein
MLSGCLVLNEKEFDVEEPVPPVIVDRPSSVPIGSILWLDAEAQNSWEIVVDVRDPNLQDELQARWRVLTEGRTNPPFEQLDLPPGSNPRELLIQLDQGDLELGRCHKLEVVVSSSFLDRTDPGVFDIFLEPDDIGRANWWIWEGDGELEANSENNLSLLRSCNALEALLETGTAATAEPPP